ncbi:hypothetical protein HMPREF9135_1246 [Segatella baroniae F0067]|uniref:Uncharacterized protein n=1 Tax=Segatella baroniae F0067 TaxID=1115809 RepID=U2QCU7_9BACT|nr:hypothetical protein HMPREF9135_1246 [Segatella baroniae F0067]
MSKLPFCLAKEPLLLCQRTAIASQKQPSYPAKAALLQANRPTFLIPHFTFHIVSSPFARQPPIVSHSTLHISHCFQPFGKTKSTPSGKHGRRIGAQQPGYVHATAYPQAHK